MGDQDVMTLTRPTLCEVNYDVTPPLVATDDWERVYTPYRYRGLSPQAPTVLHTGPGLYDVTTVGCRTPQNYGSPYPPFRTHTSLSVYSAQGSPSRALTLPPGLLRESLQGRHDDRARTAPPGREDRGSLPLLQTRRSSQESARGRQSMAPTRADTFYLSPPAPGTHQADDKDKPRWIPSLHAWVETTQNPAPYMSFVNTVQMNDRGLSRDVQVELHDLPVLPCSRFLSHMNMHEETLKALYANKNVQLADQKARRDRRLSDVLAQRGQKPQRSEAAANLGKTRPPADKVRPPPPRPPAPARPAPIVKDPSPPPTPPKQPSPGAGLTPRDTSATPPQGVGEDTSATGELLALSEASSRGTMTEPPDPSPKVTVTVTTHKPKGKAAVSKKPSKSSSSASSSKTRDISPKKKKSKEMSEKRGEISKVDLEEPPNLQLKVKSEPEPSPAPSESASANRIPPNPLEKRVRWRADGSKKQRSEESGSAQSDGWKRRETSWLYGDEDFSTTLVQDQPPEDDEAEKVRTPSPVPEPSPSPSPVPSVADETSPPESSEEAARRREWGERRRDAAWEEEQRRLRLAQERREKAQEMYERLRRRRIKDDSDVDLSGGPNFEESGDESEPEPENHLDGWLAKYCIFQKGSLQMFKRTFDIVDEEGRGYLGPVDTIVALRTINNKLSVTEEEYVYRILELVGYRVTAGADFKLFAVMAALSQRIAALDDWMKHLIGSMDFGTLERKMFMCKSLWECNVDPETNKIPIDQLCVELRAGGVSLQHEKEVRDKLGHLGALDLIDFMTYIPLFIMIHTSVLSNPLDDSRSK